MPLRRRLSLLFALATAMAVGVAGLIFVVQLRVSVDASLDPGLRAQVADLADDLGPGDPEPLGSGMFVQVIGSDGRVQSSVGPAGTDAVVADARLREALAGEVSFTARTGDDRVRVLAGPATQGGRPVVVAVGTR